MAYVAPSSRIAFYRGQRLGTELITIIPGAEPMGGELSADIDQDFARITTTSRNFKLDYNVLCYLLALQSGSNTPQIELHKAFLQETINLVTSGLRLNDLVWIDDVGLTTTVSGLVAPVTGPVTNQTVGLASLAALGSLTTLSDYVYIGSESAREGFFAKVKGQGANQITIDVPGDVLDGTVLQESARKILNGYNVYKVTFGYHRCRYEGQKLPEVPEGSQDMERGNMVYLFLSDRLPNFNGEVA